MAGSFQSSNRPFIGRNHACAIWAQRSSNARPYPFPRAAGEQKDLRGKARAAPHRWRNCRSKTRNPPARPLPTEQDFGGGFEPKSTLRRSASVVTTAPARARSRRARDQCDNDGKSASVVVRISRFIITRAGRVSNLILSRPLDCPLTNGLIKVNRVQRSAANRNENYHPDHRCRLP